MKFDACQWPPDRLAAYLHGVRAAANYLLLPDVQREAAIFSGPEAVTSFAGVLLEAASNIEAMAADPKVREGNDVS
jgi:hypothetical protein